VTGLWKSQGWAVRVIVQIVATSYEAMELLLSLRGISGMEGISSFKSDDFAERIQPMAIT